MLFVRSSVVASLAVGLVVACSEDSPRADAPSGAAGATGGGGQGGSATSSSGGTAGSASTASGGGIASRGGSTASGGTSSGGASAGGTIAGGGGASPVTDAGPDAHPPDRGSGAFTGVCAYTKDDFAALQAIGIQHARFDHPTAELIEQARTFGIEILPIADYGSADLSGQNDQMYPPLPEKRGEWAKRMVDKWRGMTAPPKVIEVWNEPWNDGFWKPAPDGAAYLELVKAFAAEAWAVWPGLTLLVSADEGFSNAFRKSFLAADETGFLNDPRILPTTHNYVEGRTPTQVTGEPCKYDLDRFECAYSDFKAHGHPDPQVWITEFGWLSNTPGGTTDVTPVSEALQATYTVDALRLFQESGHVAKAYAFLFHRNDPWNFNWLRPDNSQKPVCDAVKTIIAADP